VWFFAELPCIDRALRHRRLADFFYEHFSHFSTDSFRALMGRGGTIDTFAHGYDGEVLYALVRLGVDEGRIAKANGATAFHRDAVRAEQEIRSQIAALGTSGKRVAMWGGTGKAAAFVNRFGLDAQRFPLVVDSDRAKVGAHVPGSGQVIQFRDVLKEAPVDVVVIPTQWRAKDILAEMAREGIVARQTLIEHEGRLVDFHVDEHPYRSR
jgi:hypothetical protein